MYRTKTVIQLLNHLHLIISFYDEQGALKIVNIVRCFITVPELYLLYALNLYCHSFIFLFRPHFTVGR